MGYKEQLGKLAEILDLLDDAKKAGGFNDDRVSRLVLLWTEFASDKAGQGYWKSSKTIWPKFARKYPQPSGAKTSDVLREKLKYLYFLIYREHPETYIGKAFSEAQTKMAEFVYEYRAALGGKEGAESKKVRDFDRKLSSLLDVNDPDFFRTRAH